MGDIHEYSMEFSLSLSDFPENSGTPSNSIENILSPLTVHECIETVSLYCRIFKQGMQI